MSEVKRVWLITGASSNFGIALTRALLKAGHRVVAAARTISKIPFVTHDELLVLPMDVSEPASISRAFEEAVKAFGRIDVVVNKAGVHVCGELESIPEAAAREMCDVQLWGPARIQAEAMAIFEAQQSEGLVINISSALAVFNAPLRSMISSSKAAAEALTLARARTSPFASAINVRPGAFEKEPKTDFYPQLAAYASNDLGRTIAGSMRKQGSPPPGIGDVNKMAASVIALAELPRELRPKSVSLGSDAYSMALVCAKKRVDHLQYGQRLLRRLRENGSSPRITSPQVWFVANATSTLGLALVRMLLSSGQRVAAVVESRSSAPFRAAEDALLFLEQSSPDSETLEAALVTAASYFGRVDIVVNVFSPKQPSSKDEWLAAQALFERVFWNPILVCRAAVKIFRERNPAGAGGRIFNVLATPDSEDHAASYHNAANTATNAASTSLVRELPGKWNIAAATLTLDPKLFEEDATARILLRLAGVPNAKLPSQLPIGPRALAIAQHAAEAELSEVTSEGAMTRAMATDYAHIDGRARIGLTEAIFTMVLSPSPSIIGWIVSALSVLGWGLRLVAYEKVLSRCENHPISQ
ncbi:unnamed protein product [Peniophora sp. CBMAI 1063]|nr:unnamed protein product [Peniophora sp. CBMAI 1063]